MGFGKFVNKALHQAERHVFRPAAHVATQAAPVVVAGVLAGPQAAAVTAAVLHPPQNVIDAVALCAPEVKTVVEAVKHPEQAVLSAAGGPEMATIIKDPKQAILSAAVGPEMAKQHMILNHVPADTKDGDYDPFWLSDGVTHDVIITQIDPDKRKIPVARSKPIPVEVKTSCEEAQKMADILCEDIDTDLKANSGAGMDLIVQGMACTKAVKEAEEACAKE